MAVIGEIAVNVTARTNKFNAGMRKAQRNTRSFSSSLSRALKPLLSFGTAITGIGTIGLAGLAFGFTKVAKSIDQLAKDSVRLGIATEALQGLNFAAGIYGATSEDIAKSVIKQKKSISEATLGLITQKRAYDQLGLSAEKLSTQSAEEGFLNTLTAIRGVRKETDQLRIAQDIFGRGSAALLPLIKANESEFRKQLRTVKELGAAISKEDAAKVEAFNDEILRLKTLVGGFVQGLVIDVAPAAQAAIKGLQEWVQQVKILVRNAGFIRDRFARDNEAARIAAQTPAQRAFEQKNKAVIDRLQNLGREQDQAKASTRALGRAGSGVLGTIQGATGFNRTNLNKLKDAGNVFQSQLINAAFKSSTVGRFQIQKSVADAAMEQEAIAAEAKTKDETKFFDESLKSLRNQPSTQQSQQINRLVSATSAEGIAQLRQSRKPNEKLEKIGEEQLKQLKDIAIKLDRQEELQELISG